MPDGRVHRESPGVSDHLLVSLRTCVRATVAALRGPFVGDTGRAESRGSLMTQPRLAQVYQTDREPELPAYEHKTPDDGERSFELRDSVSLLSALPEMRAAVPDEERHLAQRALVVPAVSTQDQDLAEVIASIPSAFDFLIVEGMVLKETSLGGRSALEVLGPGDVLGPPLTAIRQIESRAISRYVAHGAVTLAALEAHFRQAARRWPGLADVLHDLLARQTHRASMHMSMLHLPRVQERVLALLTDLAERFGHVTAEGVVIDLGLSHELIGQLVASRRPTVTLALGQLESTGELTRLDGDGWRLPLSAVSHEGHSPT